MTAAITPEDFEAVSDSIDEAYAAFEEKLTVIEQTGGDDVRFPVIRAHADSLIENIEAIKDDQVEFFVLTRRSEVMRTDLAKLRVDLDRIVVPGIDDQLFYTMTGYRALGEPPSPRSEHFSEAEFGRYRYLAEMQADGNIATSCWQARLACLKHLPLSH